MSNGLLPPKDMLDAFEAERSIKDTATSSELVNLDEGTRLLFQEAPELVVKLLHLDGLRPHHITRGNFSRRAMSPEHAARREKFEHDTQVVQAVDLAARESFLDTSDDLARTYDWYVNNDFAPQVSDFSDEEVDLVEKLLDSSDFARVAYAELPLRQDRLRVVQFSGVTAVDSSVDLA